MMIFSDKKFEFQISSKKSVSDIRAFPQAGLAGQRQLLASMGALNARLRAGTQTKWGSSSAAEAVSFYSNFILSINIFQTFWRDEASRVSHFSLHVTDGGPGPQLAYTGCPSELMAPQLVIYIGCDAPECTAEQRLSNRNRLTGA